MDSAKRKDLGMMTASQSEHNTLKHMLTDGIMDVCERGLCHPGCWSVDALLGIRLDDGRIFIVNIQKTHPPAETVLSGHSTTQTSNDDDHDTSLDMHVEEITDVKQGRVGNNVGERRSKRLENKQIVSRRSGSPQATTQGNRQKSKLRGGNRQRARDRDNGSSHSIDTSVRDNVTDECLTANTDKHISVEKSHELTSGDLGSCDTHVDGGIDCDSFFNGDLSIDRATPGCQPDGLLEEEEGVKSVEEPIAELNSSDDVEVATLCGRTGAVDTADGNATVDNRMATWTCHVCGYSSSHKNNFDRHLFLHGLAPDGKANICAECGKACRDADELRTHVRIKHRKQLFHCERCGDAGKSFQSRKALRYHVATKHTGEFRFRCTVCEKTFLYGTHFRTHMNVHEGVRQLCPHCGKQFNYRASLKKHMDACRDHLDGETKPSRGLFGCEFCERMFRSKSYLTDHVHTRHLRTRRYACAACGASFLYRSGLARHRLKCPESAARGENEKPRCGLTEINDGNELATQPSVEAAVVDDFLSDTGSGINLAILSVAVQGSTSHPTNRADVVPPLGIPAASTSLLNTAAMSMPPLGIPAASTSLLNTTALSMPSTDDVLLADGLHLVQSVGCPPSDRHGTCSESMEPSIAQLFNSSKDSTLYNLQMSDVASIPKNDT